MRNETVINVLMVAVNDLIAKHQILYTGGCITGTTETDETYEISISVFGFDFDIVYNYNSDNVILFDVSTGDDVMVCDVSHNTDLYDFCDGITYYSMWLHHNDSTSAYTILI